MQVIAPQNSVLSQRYSILFAKAWLADEPDARPQFDADAVTNLTINQGLSTSVDSLDSASRAARRIIRDAIAAKIGIPSAPRGSLGVLLHALLGGANISHDRGLTKKTDFFVLQEDNERLYHVGMSIAIGRQPAGTYSLNAATVSHFIPHNERATQEREISAFLTHFSDTLQLDAVEERETATRDCNVVTVESDPERFENLTSRFATAWAARPHVAVARDPNNAFEVSYVAGSRRAGLFQAVLHFAARFRDQYTAHLANGPFRLNVVDTEHIVHLFSMYAKWVAGYKEPIFATGPELCFFVTDRRNSVVHHVSIRLTVRTASNSFSGSLQTISHFIRSRPERDDELISFLDAMRRILPEMQQVEEHEYETSDDDEDSDDETQSNASYDTAPSGSDGSRDSMESWLSGSSLEVISVHSSGGSSAE